LPSKPEQAWTLTAVGSRIVFSQANAVCSHRGSPNCMYCPAASWFGKRHSGTSVRPPVTWQMRLSPSPSPPPETPSYRIAARSQIVAVVSQVPPPPHSPLDVQILPFVAASPFMQTWTPFSRSIEFSVGTVSAGTCQPLS